MLPGMDGFSLCETIRHGDPYIGIIMASAKGQMCIRDRACALPDEDTLADRFGSRTQGSAMRAALVTGAALLLHNQMCIRDRPINARHNT